MLKRTAVLSLFFVSLFAILCANTPAEDITTESNGEYVLGSDDVVQITVYREKELDRLQRISTSGKISFPLVGEIKAEGLTVAQLESTLAEKLRKYIKNPQVTVFIKEYATITVTGQVNEPGSFPLKGELSVLEAIGLAKGFTKIAGQNDVKVMRMENGEKKTIKVKVADISRRGDKSQDVVLRRGDIVFVPESLF